MLQRRDMTDISAIPLPKPTPTAPLTARIIFHGADQLSRCVTVVTRVADFGRAGVWGHRPAR
jgi:hypothetical protein